MNQKERSIRQRVALCLIGFLFAFVVLGARSFQLHAGLDSRLEQFDSRQANHRIVLSPMRGTIYDSSGKELAVSLQLPSVFLDPTKVMNRKDVAQKLAPFTHLSTGAILEKLRNRSKRFVWLKRRIDPEIANRIDSLSLPGVYVTKEGARLYPDRELAAQVIGVVGTDGEGLEGIERMYDRFLRSQSLQLRTATDARGRPIYSREMILLEPEMGADIYVTLNAAIQQNVEAELREAAQSSGARYAMAVVMEPATGKVLAMASYPRVNPNRLDLSSPEVWRNRPVEENYEPGSTFKVFTIAGAIESGAISPVERILCRKGSLEVSGKIIRTHIDNEWLTPKEIIKYSDNIGAARIALRMGNRRLLEYIQKIGFGRKTGIDFPGEARGLISPVNQWREVGLANIGFGQGIGVTALQLTTALSAIANGGFEVRPYLVERAQFQNEPAIEFHRPYAAKRIFSPETVARLKDWMESVTEEDGTGALAAMANYRVAGKTGTAQDIDPTTGSYAHNLVVSSFMGFAPVSDPKLAAIFVFGMPKKADFGSTLAAPVFRRAIEASLLQLGVTPDKKQAAPQIPEVAEEWKRPKPQNDLAEDVVPDFAGLTVREVLHRSRQLSLQIRVSGSGLAVRQLPAPGTAVTNAKSVRVYFESEEARDRG